MASQSSDSQGLGPLQDIILQVCRSHPQGAKNEAFTDACKGFDPVLRQSAFNQLLAAGKLQVLTTNKGEILFKAVVQEEAQKLKGLSSEEALVFQVIKQAGREGLWTKYMKSKTNLPQPSITKILKHLETRKLVKAVKSVSNPNRKVYMLYELEPSRELTGGAWYTENQFDSEFIEVLREACYKYIMKHGDTTVDEIAMFIRAKGFSKVDLRADDIKTVVMTLVYDGRVDQVDGDDEYDHFRPALQGGGRVSAMTALPCGVCPVFRECHVDGMISPATCVYYDEWANSF